jgi:hypothetical protein
MKNRKLFVKPPIMAYSKDYLPSLLEDMTATKFLSQYSRCLKQGSSGYKSESLEINQPAQ